MTQGSRPALKLPEILRNSDTLEDVWSRISQGAQSGNKTLTVFDIDSTLFHVHTRHQAIVRRFFTEAGNQKKFSLEYQCLRDVEFHPREWGLWEAFRRGGLTEPTPEFQKEIRAYWNKHFFSGAFLKDDLPVQGAIEFLEKIHKKGIPIYYLTGRPHRSMHKGTLETFQKWGLPLGERTELFLKEDESVSDHDFKTEWIRRWRAEFEDIWFFENEPVNLQAVLESDPRVHLVYLDTTHSGQAHPPDTAITLSHFGFKSDIPK